VHAIINPTAGGGRAGRLQARLVGSIQRRFGPDASICITGEPGEATSSARAAIARGATLLLVAGGDGTIQEAVNGFFEDGLPLNPGCELGVLSCGTGRGFAASVGLPDSVEEQLDHIVTGPTRLLDVGRARYANARGQRAERLFVNECQAGIGGAVVRTVGMGHKRLGGAFGFGLAALSELVRSPCPWLRVQLDDGPEIAGPFLGLVAGNGARCGGGMRLTPAATPDDGALDVVLIRAMSVPARLWQFPRIYRGAHTRLRQVSSYRCHRLTIDSDVGVPLEADGELLGFPPCVIDLLPSALRVRGTELPARSRPDGTV
jgi:YegS/Rv2252/BmrU family lipid kinase